MKLSLYMYQFECFVLLPNFKYYDHYMLGIKKQYLSMHTYVRKNTKRQTRIHLTLLILCIHTDCEKSVVAGANL